MNTRKLEYWTSLFETCPPESPWQLYINEALDAVGEEHGQVLMELSEHTASFVVDVANTAAFAALSVANVSNDWRDVVESLRSKRPQRITHRCSPRDVLLLADAAMADVAGVATNLSLLIDGGPNIALDVLTVEAGILGKVQTAIATLKAIETALGGAR